MKPTRPPGVTPRLFDDPQVDSSAPLAPAGEHSDSPLLDDPATILMEDSRGLPWRTFAMLQTCLRANPILTLRELRLSDQPLRDAGVEHSRDAAFEYRRLQDWCLRHLETAATDPLAVALEVAVPPPDPCRLLSWALEQGIENALKTHAVTILRGIADPQFVSSPEVAERTVADLARGEEDPPDSEVFCWCRQYALSWLHARALAERRGAARPWKRLEYRRSLIEEPSARALAARVEELLAESEAPALASPLSGPFKLHESGGLLEWSVHAPRSPLPLRLRVRLAAARSEGLRVECSSCRAHPISSECEHGRALLENVLDALHSRKGIGLALHAYLGVAPWQRTLRRVESAVESVSLSQQVELDEAPPAWRLTPDGTELRLYHRTRKKDGGFAWGRRVEHPDEPILQRLPEPQRDLARLLEYAQPSIYRTDRGRRRHLIAHALERLRALDAGVFPSKGNETLAIRSCAVQLALRPDDAGALRLALVIDGDEALATLLAKQLEDLDPADGNPPHVLVDLATRRCLVVRLTPQLRQLALALRREPAVFPPEAAPAVLESLAKLEPHVQAEVPDSFLGEAVSADERLVLRLTPQDAGLHGEVRLRPLPGGPLVVPGEGADCLSAIVDGRRQHARRTRQSESVRATRLLVELTGGELTNELTDEDCAAAAGAPSKRWDFTVPDPQRALDLIALVRDRTDLVVEWPQKRIRLSRSATPKDLRVEIASKHDWFGVQGGVEVDGARVELALLLDAARRAERYVQVGEDQWVAISEQLQAKLQRAADVLHPGRSGLEAGPAAAFSLEEILCDLGEVRTCDRWRALAARIDATRDLEPRLPDGLQAELRPYQIAGYRWMRRLADWGMGACLADDMGLGKTVQALAMLLARADLGPALVVAPTSVGFNWMRESQRFAPGLEPLLLREGDRAATLEKLGARQVLIASYGLLLRHAQELQGIRFASLVLDEAQAVKNPLTRRARTVRELRADWTLALTGTPLENHLGELWSLMRTVAPGLLGSWEQFRGRFAIPIEKWGDTRRRDALARIVRPFILRRTKAEVAPELPPRTEVRNLVKLSRAERQLYDEARIAALARIERGEGSGDPRFEVLAALTRLRRLACHPRLYDADSEVPSSKLTRFLEIVDELRENGHRALVFSQFTSHLELVREALEQREISYLYLDGQTPPGERERRVDAFQNGGAPLFLISLKAGGTGLNLTAADYVVHLDPWWNPAVEDQATDRAHRIGQDKPVTVYRLVAQGTLEEAIVALHEQKRELVESILTGTGAAGALSTEQLVSLIRSGNEATADSSEDADGDEEMPERFGLFDGTARLASALEANGRPATCGDSTERTLARAPDSESIFPLLDAFAMALQRGRHPSWRNVTFESAQIYRRSAERYLTWARAKRLSLEEAGRPERISEYQRDLDERQIPGVPMSEPRVARTALARLEDYLRLRQRIA